MEQFFYGSNGIGQGEYHNAVVGLDLRIVGSDEALAIMRKAADHCIIGDTQTPNRDPDRV